MTTKTSHPTRRPKGEGSYYKRPSGSWSYTIKLPDGRSRTVTGKTKTICVAKAKELRKQVDAGVSQDPTLTLNTWLTYWLDEICPNRVRDRTLDGYRSYMRRYVRPQLGKHQMRAIAPEHIRALYKKMAKDGLSTSTIRQTHAILSRALKVAHQDGKLLRNPCEGIEPPQPTKRKTHGTIEISEAAAILRFLADSADTRKRARWALALLAGLRQGEALGLAWSDIDLDERSIHVHQEQVQLKSAFQLGPVKSDRSNRRIPIADELWDALTAWHEQSGGNGLVFGFRDIRNDYREWQGVLKSVHIEGKPLPPRAVHACRSATASILTAAGVPPRVVADILGHANPIVTETHYIVTGMDTRRSGMADGMRLITESMKQLPAKAS